MSQILPPQNPSVPFAYCTLLTLCPACVLVRKKSYQIPTLSSPPRKCAHIPSPGRAQALGLRAGQSLSPPKDVFSQHPHALLQHHVTLPFGASVSANKHALVSPSSKRVHCTPCLPFLPSNDPILSPHHGNHCLLSLGLLSPGRLCPSSQDGV